MSTAPDPLDARIVSATQAGLPLVPRPYREISLRTGIAEQEIQARLAAMLADGRIRRIGAVPNHYALGYTANGMSVWNVVDQAADALGPAVGALPFVSHCYLRPRRSPAWPYNLYAMVHAHDRSEVEARVAEIAALLGGAARGSEILYSRRILKKTGLRFGR